MLEAYLPFIGLIIFGNIENLILASQGVVQGVDVKILSILSIPFIISVALNISNLVSVKKLEDESERIDYNSHYAEQGFYGYDNDSRYTEQGLYDNDIWNGYENQNSVSDDWK